MISIQNSDGKLHCGGSIATSNRIITAAHCFTNQLEKKKMDKATIQSFTVVVGTATPFEYHGNNSNEK